MYVHSNFLNWQTRNLEHFYDMYILTFLCTWAVCCVTVCFLFAVYTYDKFTKWFKNTYCNRKNYIYINMKINYKHLYLMGENHEWKHFIISKNPLVLQNEKVLSFIIFSLFMIYFASWICDWLPNCLFK